MDSLLTFYSINILQSCDTIYNPIINITYSKYNAPNNGRNSSNINIKVEVQDI